MAGVAKSLSSRLAWVSLRAVCRAAMSGVDLRVEGLEHLPASGPAIIAARHYHHFYDGAALLTTMVHAHSDRLRSYELVAGAMSLEPRQLAASGAGADAGADPYQ